MREPWRDGEARAWLIGPSGLSLAMAPARAIGSDAAPAVEATWRELRGRVPRMFDGPTLAVEEWRPESSELVCRPSSYKPFAAGLAGAPVDEWLVAVTGYVTRVDGEGRERVLLGRRGGGTWLYVGMWELGPSGGVRPPRDGESFGLECFDAQLREELREEAGMESSGGRATPIAVCTDPRARSLDVVLRLRLAGAASGGETFGGEVAEYSEVRWVERGDLERFCREAPGGVIGPTAATLRALGLIR